MSNNGMVSLQDFLGDITKNYSKDMQKASEGGASGAWDGPPMPLTQEYRVEVVKGEYKPSKAGVPQIVLTYEVLEPEEFAGRKMQEYYQPNPSNEVSQRKLSELFGALGTRLDGITGNDWTVLVERFEGATGVAALRTWGEENDRYGIRWVNKDAGQVLKTNIAPKKEKKPTNSLRPDVSILKPALQPDSQTHGLSINPSSLPGSDRSAGGPNLPPGLQR